MQNYLEKRWREFDFTPFLYEGQDMIGINEDLKRYMEKYDWKDVVLDIEKFTS